MYDLSDKLSIRFRVPGRPRPRGSKIPMTPRRADGSMVMRKNGRGPLITMVDAGKNSKQWMGQVRQAAADNYQGDLFRGPIVLTVIFQLARPKAHFRTGKFSQDLKPGSPDYHIQTPDFGKLLRAIEDSLSGVIYKDDSQIVSYGGEAGKIWTVASEGAVIRIVPLDEDDQGKLRDNIRLACEENLRNTVTFLEDK